MRRLALEITLLLCAGPPARSSCSYGGLMTLMAMLQAPGIFAGGAALRPVSDWANYNNGYTARILNDPQTDGIAHKQSSPIYFAQGFVGHLLICHGLVDDNVNFQDRAMLVQRLIELGKRHRVRACWPRGASVLPGRLRRSPG